MNKLGIVITLAVLSLFVVWTPFLAKIPKFWGIDFGQPSMETIVSNFDGINFLIVAKSLYNPDKIAIDYASVLSGRENLYFSAHYPGFPLMIRLFDVVLSGPNALLFAILASNILLAIGLYIFFEYIVKNKNLAVLFSLLALFVPARMLSMRSVGSNESLFIFFVLGSLVASSKQKHLLAGIAGALAVITRSPGILLFIAYMITPFSLWLKTGKVDWKKILPYLLIPSALVGLWIYYGVVFGDFWAYFKVGGNINLYFPPFMIFGSGFDWISGMWREDIIYTYIFYATGILIFYRNKYTKDSSLEPITHFGLIYLIMLFFIVHRDLSRYALPIAPIAIAGYSHYLESKYVKWGLAILIIPVFLYSWNFIINNVQPIMDWSSFL